jgi:hypothetical protein
MDRELATFFAFMFQIDVDNGDIPNIKSPTFEEVLGLTDLAIMRKESFRNFDIENRATNSGRLRFVGQYLVFLLAKVLDVKLSDTPKSIAPLWVLCTKQTNYGTSLSSQQTTIFSSIMLLQKSKCIGMDLDYVAEFRNFDRRLCRRSIPRLPESRARSRRPIRHLRSVWK